MFGYLYEKEEKQFSHNSRFKICICNKNGKVFINFRQNFLNFSSIDQSGKNDKLGYIKIKNHTLWMNMLTQNSKCYDECICTFI